MAQCKCGQASPPWLTPQKQRERLVALILQMRKRVAGWHLSVQPQRFGSQHLMEWAIFSPKITPEITLAVSAQLFALSASTYGANAQEVKCLNLRFRSSIGSHSSMSLKFFSKAQFHFVILTAVKWDNFWTLQLTFITVFINTALLWHLVQVFIGRFYCFLCHSFLHIFLMPPKPSPICMWYALCF